MHAYIISLSWPTTGDLKHSTKKWTRNAHLTGSKAKSLNLTCTIKHLNHQHSLINIYVLILFYITFVQHCLPFFIMTLFRLILLCFLFHHFHGISCNTLTQIQMPFFLSNLNSLTQKMLSLGGLHTPVTASATVWHAPKWERGSNSESSRTFPLWQTASSAFETHFLHHLTFPTTTFMAKFPETLPISHFSTSFDYLPTISLVRSGSMETIWLGSFQNLLRICHPIFNFYVLLITFL